MWAEQYIHFYHLSVTVIRHLRLRSPSNLELSLIKFYFNCKSNLNLIWFSCFSGFIWCFIVERHQTSSLAVHHGSIKHFPAVWKSSCRNVMKIRCNAVRMRQRSCTELSLALWQTAVKWVTGAAGCCSRHPVSLRVNWIRCVQEAPTTTTTTTLPSPPTDQITKRHRTQTIPPVHGGGSTVSVRGFIRQVWDRWHQNKSWPM